MLGRITRESATNAWRAAVEAEWVTDETGLLDLGSTTATLSTVGSIAHVAAVINIGHPSRPDPALERALLSSPAGVQITDAQAVTADWVWVGASANATGHTVVDEAGMRDCRHELRAMGVLPHLVPTTMPIDERIALAGVDGLLVIERTQIPSGFQEIVGSNRLGHHPLWYGRVSRVTEPGVQGPSRIWLAFGPTADYRGSLHAVLGSIADVGFDLVHLRSHPTPGGPHVFFSAFDCNSAADLQALTATFDELKVSQRVLGVLPQSAPYPDPSAVEPLWQSN